MKRFKCLLIILTAILLFWHNGSQASETPVWEQPVSIELKEQDLFQALEAVTGQLGINLSFHGKKPKAKRDISLSQIPMSEAVSKIMRMYLVQNHAAAYNPESKTLLLAVLGSGAMSTMPPQQSSIDLWGDSQPLTVAQMDQLRKQNVYLLAEMEKASRPLSPEQLEKLREQSVKFELEREKASRPLTSEQIERLREQSIEFELERERASRPLTPEQLEKLQEQSIKFELEKEKAARPLTPEQLEKLRK